MLHILSQLIIPRVRRFGQISQFSDFERKRIVGLCEAGISVTEISRRTNRSLRTIVPARGIDRRRKTTEREYPRLRVLALRE